MTRQEMRLSKALADARFTILLLEIALVVVVLVGIVSDVILLTR